MFLEESQSSTYLLHKVDVVLEGLSPVERNEPWVKASIDTKGSKPDVITQCGSKRSMSDSLKVALKRD